MSIAEFLVNTAQVNRKTQSRGSAGELSSTGAVAISSTPLMLDVTSSEPDMGDRENPTLSGQAYFEYGVDIRAGDTFTMIDGQHINRIFSVKSNPTDEVGMGTHLVAEVESRIGGGNR